MASDLNRSNGFHSSHREGYNNIFNVDIDEENLRNERYGDLNVNDSENVNENEENAKMGTLHLTAFFLSLIVGSGIFASVTPVFRLSSPANIVYITGNSTDVDSNGYIYNLLSEWTTPDMIFKSVLASSHAIGLLIWLTSAGVCLLGVTVYSELAINFPGLDGGEAKYLELRFGPQISFIYCWLSCIALRPGSLAVIAIVFGQGLHDITVRVFAYYSPGVNLSNNFLALWILSPATLSVIVLLFISFIHLKYPKGTMDFGVLLSAIKVIALIIIIILGFTFDKTNLPNSDKNKFYSLSTKDINSDIQSPILDTQNNITQINLMNNNYDDDINYDTQSIYDKIFIIKIDENSENINKDIGTISDEIHFKIIPKSTIRRFLDMIVAMYTALWAFDGWASVNLLVTRSKTLKSLIISSYSAVSISTILYSLVLSSFVSVLGMKYILTASLTPINPIEVNKIKSVYLNTDYYEDEDNKLIFKSNNKDGENTDNEESNKDDETKIAIDFGERTMSQKRFWFHWNFIPYVIVLSTLGTIHSSLFTGSVLQEHTLKQYFPNISNFLVKLINYINEDRVLEPIIIPPNSPIGSLAGINISQSRSTGVESNHDHYENNVENNDDDDQLNIVRGRVTAESSPSRRQTRERRSSPIHSTNANETTNSSDLSISVLADEQFPSIPPLFSNNSINNTNNNGSGNSRSSRIPRIDTSSNNFNSRYRNIRTTTSPITYNSNYETIDNDGDIIIDRSLFSASLLIQTALSIVFILVGGFEDLVSIYSLIFWGICLLCTYSLICFRKGIFYNNSNEVNMINNINSQLTVTVVDSFIDNNNSTILTNTPKHLDTNDNYDNESLILSEIGTSDRPLIEHNNNDINQDRNFNQNYNHKWKYATILNRLEPYLFVVCCFILFTVGIFSVRLRVLIIFIVIMISAIVMSIVVKIK